MYKEKILESIRHLYLDEKQIIAIAGVLPTVTNLERETFEKALLDYAGNLYIPFRRRLFFNYVYAIRALDIHGVTMADYLLTHSGFSEMKSVHQHLLSNFQKILERGSRAPTRNLYR